MQLLGSGFLVFIIVLKNVFNKKWNGIKTRVFRFFFFVKKPYKTQGFSQFYPEFVLSVMTHLPSKLFYSFRFHHPRNLHRPNGSKSNKKIMRPLVIEKCKCTQNIWGQGLGDNMTSQQRLGRLTPTNISTDQRLHWLKMEMV